MTYLAPRQGMFALVILISFCLQLLFFVLSTEYQTQQNYQAATANMVLELGKEAALPLANNDRVSLSVLASRYQDNPAVSYVGIYDAKGALLVPVGDDVSTEGVSHQVTSGETVLGQVVIKAVPTSGTSIIGDYWLFVLAILVVHVLLWMLYGYIARPDEKTLQHIRQDVQDTLLAQGLLSTQTPTAPKPDIPPSTQAPTHHSADTSKPKLTVKQLLQTQGLGAVQPTGNSDSAKDGLLATQEKDDETTSKPSVAAETAVVQVMFIDKEEMLGLLAQEQKDAYIALCNQLLERCIKQTLAHPKLSGVVLERAEPFDAQKDTPCYAIYLTKTYQQAPMVMAAAMLAKLIPILNDVVYEKHRELSYFALPMKAIASDAKRAQAGLSVLDKHQQASLILMDVQQLAEVGQFISAERLKNPVSIFERESAVLTAVSEVMAQRLLTLRNQVLLAEE